MKKIPLTRDKFTLVDDEDYKWLLQWGWKTSVNGYAVRTVRLDSKVVTFYLHRVLLEKHNLLKKRSGVDHINRNRLDNRKSNLRLANQSQNAFNSGLHKNNTSGFRGVTWDKNKKRWQAQIMKNRKNIFIGRFGNKMKAVLARKNKEIEIFGGSLV